MPTHVWRQTLAGLVTARPPTSTATITAPTLIVWGARDRFGDIIVQGAITSAIFKGGCCERGRHLEVRPGGTSR
jgi:pimeloyl-ACP methyl ester carboxylesterase